ncbi:hexokinase I [Scheffersomyces coipomensis]|uniref:hexokinase I n=1 Tax=Scheffersomyces coipomensis TaxID=1788519 RepID=UPI00315D6D47
MSIKGNTDTLTNTVTNSSTTSDDDLETALDSRLSSESSSTSSSPNTTINKINDISPISTGTTTPSLLPSIVNEFLGEINDDHLNQQSDLLLHDFNEALQENSKITMLPNYNINPSGNEFGQFLVIDLGGSTLRIAIIKIDKPTDHDEADRSKRIHILNEKSWIIENNFKTIDNNFFKFIASKIAEIIKDDEEFSNCHIIKTGISWSFPLKTTNYNNGKIVHVSKGYTISDEIYNKDLKTILESVLKSEFNLLIDVKIILNDSLAVYAAGSFMDKFMKLALVLGTGTNMCCSLNKKDSDLMHDDKKLGTQDKVLFNTELSLFGQSIIKQFTNKYDGLIDSRFNQVIDLHFKTFMTVDPISKTIFQPLELTTSGRYLPELTRLVLCDLINAKEIFTRLSCQDLAHILHASYDGITGKLICFINETEDLQDIKLKLHEIYQWDIDLITTNDILNLKTIIETILTRGAFIISISVIAFIKLIQLHNPEEFQSLLDQKVINIGYVGSVLHHFNHYRHLIKQFINDNTEIKQFGLKVDFKLIENSSVIGPAIGAAYYS